MLTLITGSPGDGKTLYALEYVKAMAKVPVKLESGAMMDSRPVYYNGIKELKLPWTELLDPEKWYEVPFGSIVLLDEAQRVFRPRAYGKDVPKYVSEIETHRHAGIDLVLITQHPTLLDVNARRLCGRHLHCVRSFGMQASTVHEWSSVKDDCEKPGYRQDSIKHKFLFPIATFGEYKSAEVHTHKRRIPARVYVLLAIPFIIAAFGYSAYRWYGSNNHKLQDIANPGGASAPVAPGGLNVAPPPPRERPKSLKEYVAERTERIPGLAFTAPVYDKVTTPTIAPQPSACIKSHSKGCVCYTQQGTVMTAMPKDLCENIVANGYFVDFVDRPGATMAASSNSSPGRADPKTSVLQMDTSENIRDPYRPIVAGGGVNARGPAAAPSMPRQPVMPGVRK